MSPTTEVTRSADSVESQPFRYVPPPPRVEAQAVIGDKGRLVIPVAIREALNLQPGDELELHLEDYELRITSRWSRMRQARERAQKFFGPGRSLADELIAERRAEALKEELGG